MMEPSEIAALPLTLLAETRRYRGVTFDCLHLDPREQIRFAKGLIAALAGQERCVLEMAFEQTREEISAERAAQYLATHPEPELAQ